ncbi:hypothetical protein MCEGE10_00990 [Flavobacteriaceae bacterium]
MKIVSIFAENIYAFHYNAEADNEFDKALDLWTDVAYLQAFAKRNNVSNVYGFIETILKNAEDIQDLLDSCDQNEIPFGIYFEALQESERKKEVLSLQKGKIRKNQLRFYAIKIDGNCFVITGGAIKMSQKMDDHPDTKKELEKLKIARIYFTQNGVTDEDSFFELLIENI